MTQFNKIPAANVSARDPYLTQFALMAACCSGGIFNTVLDTLMNLIKRGIHPLQILMCLSNLAQLVADDAVKRDVLLISLMRCFVERGVAIVSEEKSKSIETGFMDLDMLLKATCICFESFSEHANTKKSQYVEIFQEFWMLLIVLGYQAELRWRPEWAEYIPVIARSSPVLIKERDRLQSPGSTFSQVVLTQSINQSLREHLASFLPNSAALIRNITFAQCLWLIAIYYAELNKLKAGIFDHLGAYLQSDVIELLGIDALVEDLVSTVIQRWKTDEQTDGPKTIRLARILMDLLCHLQPRTHQSALKLLWKHFLMDLPIYTDREIWDVVAHKLSTMFYVCRTELGALQLENVPEGLTRDPLNAATAFQDLITLCREIYRKAAKETPNYYFKFAHSKICSDRRGVMEQGDRDVALLELLRIVFPPKSLHTDLEADAEALLDLEALLYRNAEDFVHHEVGSTPMVAHMPDELLAMLTDLERPEGVQRGIRGWLQYIEREPRVTPRLLTALSIALPSNIAQIRGAQSAEPPLRAKLTATPSVPVDRQCEAQKTVSVAILLDFLSEQLCYDSINVTGILPIYLSLAFRLLRVVSGVSRFVALRTFLFAFEVLSKSEAGSGRSGGEAAELEEMVREAVYHHMIEYLCTLPDFIVSPRACSTEELRIMHSLMSWLLRESKGGRQAPGRERRTMIAAALLMLVRHHHEETLVWLSEEEDKRERDRIPLDVLRKKTQLTLLAEISLGLAMRLVEIRRLTNVSSTAETWQRRGLELTASSSLTSFTLRERLGVGADALVMAAPLLLSSAIHVFAQANQYPPTILNLAMRSLEEAPAEVLFFYIPQLVQTLRQDSFGFIERSILHIARQSPLFAHQIIWNMRANAFLDEAAIRPDPLKPQLDSLTMHILHQFSPEAAAFYQREFAFFERVTNISAALRPFIKKEKWEKKGKIDEELSKIVVDPGVYLPSNPECVVIDIDYDSGRPLQSQAKAPFLATFRVRPAAGDGLPSWQSAIFKVGDDCRQDVLALQLISLVKQIAAYHQLPVYLFPYRVVATAPGCGVIEVIPKSISRDMLGREKINSLYDYFVFRFGGAASRAFHDARLNFVRSMAAYSVVCYLFAVKDRHNGNIMIDDAGHVIHIDFGFILDITPRLGVENAPFKLTSEMLQMMGGREESPYFCWFRDLAVQLFLLCRCYAGAFVDLVRAMEHSGLPSFRGERTIRNLRNRFRLDLDAREARLFFYDLVYKSSQNVRTVLYDRFQLTKNGIPY